MKLTFVLEADGWNFWHLKLPHIQSLYDGQALLGFQDSLAEGDFIVGTDSCQNKALVRVVRSTNWVVVVQSVLQAGGGPVKSAHNEEVCHV